MGAGYFPGSDCAFPAASSQTCWARAFFAKDRMRSRHPSRTREGTCFEQNLSTPDCVSCGADGTCKLDGEIRVDQKRCQSYTPHFIPFMEKPLALSELPKEEWVCHILEESGATFVSLEDFYEPYGKALRSDLIWRIPYGCLDFSGCVLCLVQEGILCLPYDAVDSQEYELFKMDSERLLTKESLLELLQEFNEQTASLATVLMEMGKLV